MRLITLLIDDVAELVNHMALLFLLQMFQNQLKAVVLLALLAMAACKECPKDGEEFLVSFHPHLDAFWLDTDDDLKNINFRPAGFLYAMNQRNSKTILNSMLEALSKNATRKYFVSEVVFFKDWYDYLNQDQQKQVKKLFEKGQLEIPNGGWVQNDEAVCYVDDIIDQYTIGHNFLKAEFGIDTKIGWATDSFGHSHSQVAIQHLLGFQFQGIERIDDRYIYERKDGSLLEFYWSAVSDSNNRKYGGVVTYVRHFLHEVNDLRRVNPASIAGDFEQLTKNMKKLYKKNKNFRFLGNDFEEFITQEFANLEGAFDQLNSRNKECPVYKYGNPTDYLDILKESYKDSTPIREFDFMPNFDQDHYWSGYYTTNPELKKVCKDFSRLINLFRKVYTKYLNAGGAEKSNIRSLLVASDQLLSVMQHHDGITATSKLHIENLFKDRMGAKTIEIIKTISQLKEVPRQNCNLYQNGNACAINSQDDIIYFSVIHQGATKKERLEIVLPKGVGYDVQDDDNDEIFCHPNTEICNLVFEPNLKSGENVFVLQKIDSSKVLSREKAAGSEFRNNAFTVKFNSSSVHYSFNSDEFIKISYVLSPNRNSNTDTYTWDKYGNKISKGENRMPGIYIMANTGSITQADMGIKEMYVTVGKVFSKIYLPSQTNDIVITIKNTEKNVIDLETTFKPTSRNMADYFIQVESKINSRGQFYHDSNGYLVIKRNVGIRPDYTWHYKAEDKINANTYPMCSFAYGIEGDKKLVIFTDRAQGFAQFDNTYLINIDRLAGDDYKGVGQGFYQQIQNTFHHKIGIVNKNQFIEREWQREFDQPLIGFYSNIKRTSNAQGLLNQNSKHLKYTIFSLNADEYVIRLFNLGETTNINLPIYSSGEWNISQLNLNLKFADIKESFANGLVLSERKAWNKITGEINMFNGGSKDTHSEIVLSPLQVRSFRINLKNKIAGGSAPLEKNPLLELTLTDVSPVVKPFAKRCF